MQVVAILTRKANVNLISFYPQELERLCNHRAFASRVLASAFAKRIPLRRLLRSRPCHQVL